jgi:DNA processing protein
MNINSTSPDKHKFLKVLAKIDKPVKTVFYSGDIPSTRIPTVAIVGTRKPTAYGKEITYKLAADLAKKGVVIVSGLALGVDGIAHTAACDAGGITVAVLPSGLPRIYPSSHRGLAERILEMGGALITEYEEGMTNAYQSNLLARNRIVSGLADAILITEAAARSGTLNTAAHALAQGKEIFVVPGNITSPMSAGCNALIKQGAHVATVADDIIEHIAPQLLQQQTQFNLGSNPAESAIITELQAGLRDGDEIQRKTGLSSTEFNTSLTMLEVQGTIRALGANQWTLL